MLKVTCAIIVYDRKILVTQNSINSDHPLQWEFPGGKIKKGENARDCILREIKEELEMDVQIVENLLAEEHDYEIKKIVLIPFLCTVDDPKLHLKEHHSFKWLDPGQLKDLDLAAADRKLLNNNYNFRKLKEYIGEKMHNT